MVANLYLGREQNSRLPLDEVGMEKRSLEVLRNLSVSIPSVRTIIASLSGGQRQSVAISRAVMWNSKLVILDEPTAALGVAQTHQVLQLIKNLRQQGLAVIVISHNIADIFEVVDRISVLYLGRNNGMFNAHGTSQEQIVGAITGAEFGNGDQDRLRRDRKPREDQRDEHCTRMTRDLNRIDPKVSGGWWQRFVALTWVRSRSFLVCWSFGSFSSVPMTNFSLPLI